MKQAPKTVHRRAKVLTDPNPSFVSIVDHGAIQEPFSSLKHAEKGSIMPIAQRSAPATKPALPINSNPTLRQKAAAVTIRKMVFDKTVYKDETAVSSYLNGEGYQDSGFVVKADGETFVAEVPGTSDDHFSSVVKVSMEDGITGYVGTKKADAPTQKKVVKAADTALKFDWWASYCSKGETVVAVLEAGMSDGIPPGVDVIFASALTAIGNVLGGDSEDRSTKVAGICAEMGSMITAVDDLFAAAMASDAAQKHDNVKKFIDEYNKGVKFLTDTTVKTEPAPAPAAVPATPVAAPAVPAVKTEPAAVPAVQEPATPVVPVVPAPTGTINAETLAALSGVISKAVNDAVAPLNQEIAAIKTEVGKATASAADTATKSADAITRLSAIASRAPSKKGIEDGTEAPTAPVVDQARIERREEAQANIRRVAGL